MRLHSDVTIMHPQHNCVPIHDRAHSVDNNFIIDNHSMSFGDLISTSNLTEDEHVYITVSHPVIWSIDFLD